jgi:hypothetical protein
MRLAYLLCLVPVLFSGGCAGLIARSGTDPTEFKTMELVHAKFGEPFASGPESGDDGAFYEEYLTHRKICYTPEWFDGDGYAIFFVATLGLIDFQLVPQELYETAKRMIGGQTLRFTYNSNGKLIKVQRDGNAHEFMQFNFRDASEKHFDERQLTHQNTNRNDDAPVAGVEGVYTPPASSPKP